MEAFEQSLARAKKEIGLADHLLYITYQLVNDPKFLLAIAEHTIIGVKHALQSLLEYERYYKRVEPFANHFGMHIDIYREKVEKRYGFNPKFLMLLKKIRELEYYSQKSVMRFKRGNSYILATPRYEMKRIDLDNIKRYSNAAKDFVTEVEKIIKTKEVEVKKNELFI